MKYRTTNGDVLDAICTEYYELNAFDLHKIYAANIGLARLGPVFGAGVVIELPKTARVQAQPVMIRLVD